MSALVEQAFLSAIKTLPDYSWALRSGVGEEHFASYQPVWKYISDFVARYNGVPNRETLIAQFPDCPLMEVTEPLQYEHERLLHAYMARSAKAVMMEAARTVDADPLGAINSVVDALGKIQTSSASNIGYLDRDADQRLETFKTKFAFAQEHPTEGFLGIKTGIEILDIVGYGWMPGSVNAIIGLTGTGKSELVIRSIVEAWLNGHKVLVVSPEMTRTMIGYRQDVIMAHLQGIGIPTNMELMSGRTSPARAAEYESFIERLTHRDDILCIEQRGTDRPPTVPEVRAYARQHGAQLVVIDGFKLLTDAKRGANQYERHVNIFTDLLNMTNQDGYATILVEHVTRNVKVNALPTVQESNMGQHLPNGCERILALGMVRDRPLQRYIASLKQRFGPSLVARKLISYDVNGGDVGRWIDPPAQKIASDLGQYVDEATLELGREALPVGEFAG